MRWLANIDKGIGSSIGTSGWMTVSQERIDRFAAATEDFQFIHVDPQRAGREAPFGGTIAHGMLTLSLISALAAEALPPSDELNSIVIVGIDRVKFVAPLRSGKRVRGVFTLDRTIELAKDRVLLKVGAIIEIEAEVKPALTCDVSWLAVLKNMETTLVVSSVHDATIG